MIKAERIKKKMGLGRGGVITIETVQVGEKTRNLSLILFQVRERAARDSSGNFVGIICDEESPVDKIGEDVSSPAAEDGKEN